MTVTRTASLMLVLLFAPYAIADIVIYQDDFSEASGTIMNGKSLDMAVGTLGGTAGATWTASPDTVVTITSTRPTDLFRTSGSSTASIGTTGTNAGWIENNRLPFTPVSGAEYTLSLDVSPSGVGASGNWLGLAFHQANYNNHTPGGSSSALSNDNPYGLIILKGTGVVQSFAGLGTANGVISSAAGFIPTDAFTSVDIVLNTMATQWTVKWLLNGTQVGSTFTYTTNPTIGLISFGSNKLAGSVRDFSLTAVVPEIPGWATSAVCLLGIVAVSQAKRWRSKPAAEHN